ncbi:hypothetical protein KBA41_09140 [Candidatus Ozemobacteraceae bacterium]|nr:hypothetical protein [Candidatus Ozemobacteraceae bacterium]
MINGRIILDPLLSSFPPGGAVDACRMLNGRFGRRIEKVQRAIPVRRETTKTQEEEDDLERKKHQQPERIQNIFPCVLEPVCLEIVIQGDSAHNVACDDKQDRNLSEIMIHVTTSRLS